ncbi:hypothetical protein QQS21_010491 [Conoideocrella luteorostrata]|uniref:Uncharacterized protein n=1 Tax=Conoideocrella luteorostrata TaxID=1105319 RepID=A0AAJ0FUM5_9HYPO|nr:hypothetical protein QQS21_010491 [Conoideocrella luteorostrata]
MESYTTPYYARLQGTSNWNQWISIVKMIAVAEDVWHYLDPEAADRPELVKPVAPIPNLVDLDTATILNLDAEQFKRIEFLSTQYRFELEDYYRQKKAILSIQRHIMSTTGSFYGPIELENDVARQLELLQNRFKPTIFNR